MAADADDARPSAGFVGADAIVWERANGPLAGFRGPDVPNLRRPWPGTDFRGANLSSSDVSGCSLDRYDFRRADFRLATIVGAHLRRSDFRWADLTGVDMRGTSISACDLRHADLTGADLRDVRLGAVNDGRGGWGVDLSHAQLRGVDLRGASYDATTIWPDRFDPESAGATTER
jgi:uncharacterized protein YjbI with pentapeptide repeats